jgi:uncharacterized protein DUF3551
MRIVVLAGMTLTALFVFGPHRGANASPWCSTYGGMTCGFETYEQCMINIRGIGGNCIRNPSEPVAAPAPVVTEQPAPATATRAEKKKPPKKPVATVAPQS